MNDSEAFDCTRQGGSKRHSEQVVVGPSLAGAKCLNPKPFSRTLVQNGAQAKMLNRCNVCHRFLSSNKPHVKPVRTTPEERFWAKIEKTDGCWNWKANRNNAGYGLLNIEGQMVLAHRFSYELSKGKIPNGLTIDHLCRNRICVNPNHLEAVTFGENILRGTGPTAQNAKKTHCQKGHSLTEGNLVLSKLKTGTRECLICTRVRDTEFYAKNSERIKSTRRKRYSERKKLYQEAIA